MQTSSGWEKQRWSCSNAHAPSRGCSGWQTARWCAPAKVSIFTSTSSTWQRAHVVGGSLPEGVEALLLPVEPLPCVVPVIPWENPLQNYDLLIISILIGWGAQKQWQPGKLPVITLTKCPNGLKSQKSKVLVQLKKRLHFKGQKSNHNLCTINSQVQGQVWNNHSYNFRLWH